MVIGDDAVEIEGAGALHGLVGLDAGVHGDHQLDPLPGGLLQHRNLHSVALHQPLRDMVGAFRAQHLQSLSQDDHGGVAVNVVVAVNQDLLAPVDGLTDAVDGQSQVAHEEGIVEMAELWV